MPTTRSARTYAPPAGHRVSLRSSKTFPQPHPSLQQPSTNPVQSLPNSQHSFIHSNQSHSVNLKFFPPPSHASSSSSAFASSSSFSRSSTPFNTSQAQSSSNLPSTAKGKAPVRNLESTSESSQGSLSPAKRLHKWDEHDENVRPVAPGEWASVFQPDYREFSFTRDVEATGKNETVTELCWRFVCRFCGEDYSIHNSISVFDDHIRYDEEHLSQYTQWLQEQGTSASKSSLLPTTEDDMTLVQDIGSTSFQGQPQKEAFFRAVLDFVVVAGLPCTVLDMPEFKAMVSINARTANPFVPSSHIARRSLMAYKAELYERLKDKIRRTCSHGSVTIGSWTSSAGNPYLGITLHWLDHDFHPHECVLGLKPQPYPHTGANIRDQIDSILSAWELDGKVFAATTDATANMTLAIKMLSETRPHILHRQCVAHVLHNSVRKALKATKVLGSLVTKCGELVSFFRLNPKYKQRLARQIPGNQRRILSLDCATRCNSTFFMIQRLYRLRAPLRRFQLELAMLNEAPGVQFLDDDEWDALVTLQDCLQPFNELAEFVSTTLDTTANPIISFEDNSNEAFNLAKGIGGNNRRPIVSGDDVEDTDVTRSRTDAKDCSDDDSTDDEDADVILNDDGEYEGNGGLDILDHGLAANAPSMKHILISVLQEMRHDPHSIEQFSELSVAFQQDIRTFLRELQWQVDGRIQVDPAAILMASLNPSQADFRYLPGGSSGHLERLFYEKGVIDIERDLPRMLRIACLKSVQHLVHEQDPAHEQSPISGNQPEQYVVPRPHHAVSRIGRIIQATEQAKLMRRWGRIRHSAVDEEISEYLRLVNSMGWTNNASPFQWWRVHRQQFPHLAELARKYLSAAVLSVSSERLFSHSSGLLTKKRDRLSDNEIDARVFVYYAKKCLADDTTAQ